MSGPWKPKDFDLTWKDRLRHLFNRFVAGLIDGFWMGIGLWVTLYFPHELGWLK